MIRSRGHCNTMGTASTMACMAEALGMTIPGIAGTPARNQRHRGGHEHRGLEGGRLHAGQDRRQCEDHEALDHQQQDEPEGQSEQLSSASHARPSVHRVATFSFMADGARPDDRAGAADHIVFLGHATVLIELDGVRLLTDPLLRDHVAHLRRQVPPPDPATYADIDAVLISHLHHDHLDLASLRLLGLEIPLIVPAGAAELLRRDGFDDITELGVGETTRVGALVVRAVEARHDGRRRPGPRGQRAETLGYVVNGRRSVYFAGDTELFEDMSSIADAPDVALLPVAGWGPTLGAGHMDPLDAARAARLIRAADRDPDALGDLAAGRSRWTPRRPARRSATDLRRAPRVACAQRRGQDSAAGAGDGVVKDVVGSLGGS